MKLLPLLVNLPLILKIPVSFSKYMHPFFLCIFSHINIDIKVMLKYSTILVVDVKIQYFSVTQFHLLF